MSISVPSPTSRDAEAGQAPSASQPLLGLPFAVTAGCLLALAMTLGKAIAVWRTGIFFDPDDAMRAVEVRDFLNGQGWFDLVQHRLLPGHSFAMHWSRLVDVPLAGLMLMFRHWTDPDTAERITRLLEPPLFYLVFLLTLCGLARDLVGKGGPLAVALLAAGSLEIVGNFIPGHIHHHALQVMLLALLAKLFCDGLDPGRSWRMAWAGAAAALSLAINLQNLPFVVAAAGILGLLWAWHGTELDRALARFGGGLCLAALGLFLVQVPPSRYFEASCDAFGAPHLLGIAMAGLAFGLLAGLTARLRTHRTRLAALCAAGALSLLIVRIFYPACLGDPYGAVEPLVRERYMAEIGEAMPLAKLLGRDPWGTIPIVMALALGTACILAAVRHEAGLARARWIAIGGFGLVGLAGTIWQVRVASSAEIFACLGGAWCLCRTFGPQASPRRYGTLLCVVAGLGLSQAGWTSVLSIPKSRASGPVRSAGLLPPVDPDACFAPASYDWLRDLPRGLVLSTIDPGAHILAYTAHSAIAASYHRDGYGIRVALLAFEAAPEDARAMIEKARADYLMLCTTSPETHEIVSRSPNGFGAQILSGHLPPWLEAVPSGQGPLKLFKIVDDLRR